MNKTTTRNSADPQGIRIIFPFNIKQVEDRVVVLKLSDSGRPIVQFELHPDLLGLVPDDKLDDIFSDAINAVVQASITVQS